MVIGDRLNALRKATGLTQSQFGELIGVKKSVICLYERALRNPTIESIVALCQIFNVNADYLIGNDELATIDNNNEEHFAMTKEEVDFIIELRKNKAAYALLVEDLKRGMDFLKSKIN